MSRLPKVGGDDQIWGDLLNDFLSVEHRANGIHDTASILQTPQQNGLMLVSNSSKPRGVDGLPVPAPGTDVAASNGLTAVGGNIQLGGALSNNRAIALGGKTLGFTNSSADKTEIDGTGFVKVTRSAGANSFIEGWRVGEANPRFLVDAFGTLHVGGTGTSTPQHIIAKDSGNAAWLNYRNAAGPAS